MSESNLTARDESTLSQRLNQKPLNTEKLEDTPSKVDIIKKIINLISQGREGNQLMSELGQHFRSSDNAELVKLTAEVVAKYSNKETFLRNDIEKIANEIANSETKQVNNDLKGSVGHQNPESILASPRQESDQANSNGTKNHVDRLEQQRTPDALMGR